MVPATWKGALLGAFATIAAAGVIGLQEASGHRGGRAGLEAFFVVCFIGMLPGLMIGAALGKLGERLTAWRRSTLCGIAEAWYAYGNEEGEPDVHYSFASASGR